VSGGEKQRLSIARALLRKPALLVFDEATSALDSLTEEEIGKTVRDVSVSQQHLTILIAHRLSTVLHADQIFVLEKGHIAEAGTHGELLEKKASTTPCGASRSANGLPLRAASRRRQQ
jgi:ATP-binding cassette subfamily B protein